MKKIILSILLTFFISLAHAGNGIITVEISGIKEIKGQISIGLYNKSDGFPDKGREYKGVVIKIKGKSVTYAFSGVPNGDYAIAIFQDSNNNGKLDKNFWGIPKERFAFSRNATGTFGAPGFNKAKFKLNGNYTAKIKLK